MLPGAGDPAESAECLTFRAGRGDCKRGIPQFAPAATMAIARPCLLAREKGREKGCQKAAAWR
jgi:hypothetical protein